MTDQELIYAYLDDELDEEQLVSFEERLTSEPELCRLLVEASRQQVLLEDFDENVSVPKPTEEDFPESQIKPFPRTVLYIAAVAAMLLVVCYVFLLPDNGPRVYWEHDGLVKEVSLTSVTKDGLHLVADQESLLRLPDQTSVKVSPCSEAFLSKSPQGWTIKVAEGEVTCTVAKQPKGQTFSVLAKDLKVIVVGTRFRVAAEQESATVVVTEGKVKVLRGDKSYLVSAGQRLNAVYPATGVAKVSHEETVWTAVPSTTELPQQCDVGELLLGPDGIPAIKATFSSRIGADVQSKAVSFDQEKGGLFTYEDNLYITFEYKLSRAGHWLGLWVRGEDYKTFHYASTAPHYDMWMQKRLPLSQLKSMNEDRADLQAGEPICRLMLMTQGSNDAELLVRNIIVTRQLP